MDQEFTDGMQPKSKGLAIAALIFGILSMLCCCVGFPFALVGLILAIICIIKKKGGMPAAIIGLILSILCFIFTTISVIRVLPYSNDIKDYAENSSKYIEEYDKTGELPPLIERIKEDSNLSDEYVKSLMDSLKQVEDGINDKAQTTSE